MDSEKELNSKILKITNTIEEKYPEFYEHLGKMLVTIPDDKNPETNIKKLEDYYDSLKFLWTNYIREHLPEEQSIN